MQDTHRHIPVEIQLPRKYAKGGLATAAKDVAAAGEGGDTMLVHVNKAEFEMLRKQWGDPTINDKTGLPSYSWGSWLGPIAGVVGGLTGVGGSIGDAIGNATGLYDAGSTASSAIGSGLLGAGVGAISGGARGALYGGLAGGATPYLSNFVTGGDGNGSLLPNGLSGLFGGGAGGGSSVPAGSATADAYTKIGDAAGGAGASAGGASNGLGALLSGSTKYGYTPLLLAGLLAANAFGQKRGPSADSQAAKASEAAQQAKFNAPLPQVNFQRTLLPLAVDPRKYGFGPTQDRFVNNGLGYADGGAVSMVDKIHAAGGIDRFAQRGNNYPDALRGVADDPSLGYMNRPGSNLTPAQIQSLMENMRGSARGYARGGSPRPMGALGMAAGLPNQQPNAASGRADNIPARLSPNEYVIDAETTALLGDGSPQAGAAKLDQMRENIRKHKGGALAQGRISPNANSPESYMRGNV